MENILIIDDTPEFRTTIATILRKSGYEVSEAENGRQAIELVNSVKPQLILLDVLMPEMDGMSFLGELNAYKEFDKTPVILLTGLVIQDSLVKAANDRIVDYLVKANFTIENLLEKVKSVLDRATVTPPKTRTVYDYFASLI